MARANQRRLGRGLQTLLASPPDPGSGRIVESNDSSSVISPPESVSDSGIIEVEIDRIGPNPDQPRRRFDDETIRALADSIAIHGVLQPVIVRPRSGGGTETRYELIAGERRWRAARRAGLLVIPSIIRTLDDRNTAELALIENIQREDLNPIDRAQAFQHLIEQFGLTQAEVARRVGIDRSSVANLIRLTELEAPIQELIAGGTLSTGHGKALLTSPAGDARIELASRAARESWSVRALEKAARASPTARTPPQRKDAETADPDTDALAAQLGEHLGTRVKIHRSGTGGRIEIVFFDHDHFDAVAQRMRFHYDT
ncbi:MAG: ParB/RepB/Spo0J family partition protein [Planctomycetota bacterium]